MCLVNSEKRDRSPLQPVNRVIAGESLRRMVEQPQSSFGRVSDDFCLLVIPQRTIQAGSRNSHLLKLRNLILHQGNQWGNDDNRL